MTPAAGSKLVFSFQFSVFSKKTQHPQDAEKKCLEGVWGNTLFIKVSPRSAISTLIHDEGANKLPQGDVVRDIIHFEDRQSNPPCRHLSSHYFIAGSGETFL